MLLQRYQSDNLSFENLPPDPTTNLPPYPPGLAMSPTHLTYLPDITM